MSRRPVMLAFALMYLALVGSANCEDSSNETEQKTTYRSGIEMFLQGIEGILPSGDSSENGTTSGFGEILNAAEKHFHTIFPGTLWCGGGNIASSEQDVGIFDDTDACCRTHDNCPSNISAGKTKGPLYNNGVFTRSACSCDHEFYHCLKNASSIISTNIGTTYFNILRPQCFAEDYPIEDCAERGTNRIVERKCLKYNLDETQDKTLEWFDNPDF